MRRDRGEKVTNGSSEPMDEPSSGVDEKSLSEQAALGGVERDSSRVASSDVSGPTESVQVQASVRIPVSVFSGDHPRDRVNTTSFQILDSLLHTIHPAIP